jgi:hypothetical protein
MHANYIRIFIQVVVVVVVVVVIAAAGDLETHRKR